MWLTSHQAARHHDNDEAPRRPKEKKLKHKSQIVEDEEEREDRMELQ